MAYRKYDTCFFERYSMLVLKTVLGHKYDDLVNEDRPDLQSSDGHTLGIEVTRSIEGGKAAAQEMLKDLAGISAERENLVAVLRKILSNGYGDCRRVGRHAGGLEIDYWGMALPMKEVITNKVRKVSSGFYGDFDEYGLFVFSKDPLDVLTVGVTLKYIMDIQQDKKVRYSSLFLHCAEKLYVCNLEDDISPEYRITDHDITQEQRKRFYLESLDYGE